MKKWRMARKSFVFAATKEAIMKRFDAAFLEKMTEEDRKKFIMSGNEERKKLILSIAASVKKG